MKSLIVFLAVAFSGFHASANGFPSEASNSPYSYECKQRSAYGLRVYLYVEEKQPVIWVNYYNNQTVLRSQVSPKIWEILKSGNIVDLGEKSHTYNYELSDGHVVYSRPTRTLQFQVMRDGKTFNMELADSQPDIHAVYDFCHQRTH